MRAPKHPSRQPVIKRLRRAEGHLRSVTALLATTRSTVDIAQQIRAVEVAVAHAKQQLIHDHMQHCVDQRDLSGNALRELRQLAKFL